MGGGGVGSARGAGVFESPKGGSGGFGSAAGGRARVPPTPASTPGAGVGTRLRGAMVGIVMGEVVRLIGSHKGVGMDGNVLEAVLREDYTVEEVTAACNQLCDQGGIYQGDN